MRADRGTENAKISFLHPFLRHQATDGTEDSSARTLRYGRSVNNQVGSNVLVVVYVVLATMCICRELNATGEVCTSGVVVFGLIFFKV